MLLLLFLSLFLLGVVKGFISQSTTCQSRWASTNHSAHFTFVVPAFHSLSSLENTVQSIISLKNPDWYLVIAFHGLVSNTFYLNETSQLPIYYRPLPSVRTDPRICFLHYCPSITRTANIHRGLSKTCNKLSNSSNHNNEMGLRNYAVKFVKTKWVGFVQEGDTVDSSYFERFQEHVQAYPHAKGMVFQSCDQQHPDRLPVLPSHLLHAQQSSANLTKPHIALHTTVYHDYLIHMHSSRLSPSSSVAFSEMLLLHQLVAQKTPLVFSPHIIYQISPPNSPLAETPLVCKPTGSLVYLDAQHDQNVTMSLTRDAFKDCVTNATDESAALAALPRPKFVFSENHNVFFGHNIDGLQQSLAMALDRNCHNAQHPAWKTVADPTISVVFDANAKPSSALFIQVQLEQRNTFHFTPAYYEKLRKAVQIWEFNPMLEPINGVSSLPQFVPTMLMLDRNFVYQCAKFPPLFNASHHAYGLLANDAASSSSSSSNSNNNGDGSQFSNMKHLLEASNFALYRKGFYYFCQVDNKGNVRFARREPSPCRKTKASRPQDYCYVQEDDLASAAPDKVCQNSMLVETENAHAHIDALMFGKLSESHENTREKLCDALIDQDPKRNIICAEGIFGTVLQHMVCRARTVVVSHFFRTSSLETHRIDPLLQAGKVVVAETSLSTTVVMDSVYSRAMPIVPFDDIANTTHAVVQDYAGWLFRTSYHRHRKEFVHRATSTVDPLCFALSQLPDNIRLKQ